MRIGKVWFVGLLLLFVSFHANHYGMVCRAVASIRAIASVCVYVHANRYGMVCKAVASICVYVHAIGTVWFVGLLLLFVSVHVNRYGMVCRVCCFCLCLCSCKSLRYGL